MGATNSQPPVESTAGASVEQLTALLVQKDERIATLERQVAALLEQFEKIRQLKFADATKPQATGSWVDALLGLQGTLPSEELVALRNEAGTAKQDVVLEAATVEGAEPSVSKPAKARRGPRSEFPEHLPRKIERLELTEVQRRAACGAVMQEIGVDVTRRLERLSVTFVVETQQVKYACKVHPEEGVRAAPTVPSVIEGGLLGTSMLADVIVERMGNQMPYHRLEQKYASEGLSLSRSVLCNSAHRCAELLEPVYRAQFAQILGDVLVQFDATSVVVRNGQEEGRALGQIWAYRGQRHGLVCYQFTPDKCAQRPEAVLSSYRGLLQCDAASGHNGLFGEGSGRTEVGCLAHAFRKFEDAVESEPTLAREAMHLIDQLYGIERKGKAARLDVSGRAELRRVESKPVLARSRTWLEATLPKVLPNGPLAKAIRTRSTSGSRSLPSPTTAASKRSTTTCASRHCGGSPWAARTGCSSASRSAVRPTRSS
jgi:transposase